MQPKPPKVTHVAMRFRNVVYSLPAPCRHHHIIADIVEKTKCEFVDAHGDDQGFLDASGSYLTRKQALDVARLNEQLKPGCMGERLGQLYSEDVW
jgi:hypothetical protein